MRVLVDATINTLAERGYAGTSLSAICGRCGLSQGAIFRHFKSRIDLIGHAADEIGRRHVAGFTEKIRDVPPQDLVKFTIAYSRETTRSVDNIARHEILLAARCDEELRAALAPTIERFEQAVENTIRDVLHVREDQVSRLVTVLMAVLHLFESEAVSRVVKVNESMESRRYQWVLELLNRELEQVVSGTATSLDEYG